MRIDAMVLFAVALVTPTMAQKTLPEEPNSSARMAPIKEFLEKAKVVSGRFEPHTYKNAAGETMPYRLVRPEGIENGRRYPLIVYLHGAGGLGTDNSKNYLGGNLFGSHLWALPENQKKHPAFIVAPQTESGWGMRRGQPPPADGLTVGARLAFEIVDKLKAELPIDLRRIYVMGNSMGGVGSWYVIAKRPEMFAAAVPMCGAGDPSTAPAFKKVPIWNFHGDADKTVPVQSSRLMVEAARKAGGNPLYTEYPGVGHNVAQWAVTEPALVEWLFAQKK